MEEYRNCKLHGNTLYIKRIDSRFRCKKCAVIAVQKKREALKLKAIEYKGNKCCRCGYDKCKNALSFHHTDPTQKDFGISAKGYTRAWNKVVEELDKCILVCCNCHAEIHAEINATKGSVA